MKELFMRFPEFKTKAFTMSFDDGTVFDREMVQILDNCGLKCTFNLNSDLFGEGRHIFEDEVKSLYKNQEIAVHTCNHPHLSNLDDARIIKQVVDDRDNLERISGRIVKGMAYPFCLDSKRVRECVLRCGINYARTVVSAYGFSLPDDFLQWNPTCHHNDKKLNELFERFLAEDDVEHPWRIETKVFYLWGHSYEFENCFDKLQRICDIIAGKKEVWYATNGDIFKYVQSYKRLEFSVSGKIIANPTDTDIYAFCDNKNLLIPANSTLTLD